MAITKGLSIVCNDMQRTGGISQIFLRSWATGDLVTFVSTAGTNHEISNITDSGAATADWFMYEFKDETPTLNITATKENGSTSFDCVLTFYLPRINNYKSAKLQELLNTCMMGIIVDTNGNNYVIGASQKYSVGGSANPNIERSQTYLNLTSMEGQTGAAYSEENGITVTLTARQYELPRIYTGVLTPDVDEADMSATTT
tara:strand:+ start:132 stop:734 length:603 start_codon:yes stop_codon:yes gene_type:complete